MAFGVGELGLRLDDLYDMTFFEFQLKSYAYNRMQKERLRHTRLIAYYGMVGSHYDPKKLPKNLEDFIKIDDVETIQEKNTNLAKVKEEWGDIFIQRRKEYEALISQQNKV